MTRLAVIVPTTGQRRSLSATLDSLVPQLEHGDRCMVICDDLSRYDFCSEAVGFAREAGADGVMWRCYPNREQPGFYGHASRNIALNILEDLEDGPDWVWSLDDDDVATFGAVDMIRSAIASGEAQWYVFRMRGGAGSHFPGVVVPTLGPRLLRGNVGTPMMVFPVCSSRFGSAEMENMPAGYFGDYQQAQGLLLELGEPQWQPEIVAEIRPVEAGA